HRFEVSEADYRLTPGAVARARLRWRSYVSYPLHLREELRSAHKSAIAVICSNTFYAPAVAMRAARHRGLHVVNWVLDLFPDVLVAGGTIAPRGILNRQLGRLARATFAAADANVFLGERLMAYATARHGEIPRARVIPVGADGRPFRATAPQPRPSDEAVQILYCGNLGRMHETDTLVDVLRAPPAAGWTMTFRGHGVGYRQLQAAVGTDSPARFGPGLPDAKWAQALQAADVALVTLKRGAEGLVMPSKTYSAMVAGQAVLAVCPRASDLAETILAADAGWVVEPGDANTLRAILASLVRNPAELLHKRRNAFAAGHRYYDQRVVAQRWTELLGSLGSRHDA
ncbi:MAG TPA: glycosyltransferase, partial [Polyangia bacterium]|nr:glycosyltransferase [Polyangia bacterium]